MQKHREDAPSLTSQFLRHRQALYDVICREYLAAVNSRYLGQQVGIYFSFASPMQNSMNLKKNTGFVQGKQLQSSTYMYFTGRAERWAHVPDRSTPMFIFLLHVKC